jgi:hypothetical protein
VSKGKTNTNSTAAALDAARAERLEAGKLHEDAVAAADVRRAEQTELRERSAAGDDSVTGLDLVTVDADVAILDGRVRVAAGVLSHACEAEKVATTAAIAEEITSAFDADVLNRVEAEAVEVIAGALAKLAQQRTEANTTLRQGVRDAIGAGLDYTSPGRVRLGHDGFTGRPLSRASRLVVDGRRFDAVDPASALLAVLSEATRRAGYRLDVAHGSVTVTGS